MSIGKSNAFETDLSTKFIKISAGKDNKLPTPVSKQYRVQITKQQESVGFIGIYFIYLRNVQN